MARYIGTLRSCRPQRTKRTSPTPMTSDHCWRLPASVVMARNDQKRACGSTVLRPSSKAVKMGRWWSPAIAGRVCSLPPPRRLMMKLPCHRNGGQAGLVDPAGPGGWVVPRAVFGLTVTTPLKTAGRLVRRRAQIHLDLAPVGRADTVGHQNH